MPSQDQPLTAHLGHAGEIAEAEPEFARIPAVGEIVNLNLSDAMETILKLDTSNGHTFSFEVIAVELVDRVTMPGGMDEIWCKHISEDKHLKDTVRKIARMPKRSEIYVTSIRDPRRQL